MQSDSVLSSWLAFCCWTLLRTTAEFSAWPGRITLRCHLLGWQMQSCLASIACYRNRQTSSDPSLFKVGLRVESPLNSTISTAPFWSGNLVGWGAFRTEQWSPVAIWFSSLFQPFWLFHGGKDHQQARCGTKQKPSVCLAPKVDQVMSLDEPSQVVKWKKLWLRRNILFPGWSERKQLSYLHPKSQELSRESCWGQRADKFTRLKYTQVEEHRIT